MFEILPTAPTNSSMKGRSEYHMPSAGFFVISFVAVLIVFVPSVVFFAYGWRSSRASRAFSLLALVVFVFFAWAAFTDPEASDFEARAFILYVTWGVALYLSVAIGLGFKFLSSLGKRLRARQSGDR